MLRIMFRVVNGYPINRHGKLCNPHPVDLIDRRGGRTRSVGKGSGQHELRYETVLVYALKLARRGWQ